MARLREVETLPVIRDRQLHVLTEVRQGQADALGARMPGDVLKGLLGNAVQAERHVGRDAVQAGLDLE